MIPTKVRSRTEAEQRYGHIDFASRIWSDERKWMKLFVVPAGWFPYWYVLDTKQPVRGIYCNVDIHVALQAALQEIRFHGLGEYLKTFDGCWNIRMVRGSRDYFSAHAYGLALDLNAATNQLGSSGTDFSRAFIECFTKHGFDWGGNFRSRPDPMHFSRCWESP